VGEASLERFSAQDIVELMPGKQEILKRLNPLYNMNVKLTFEKFRGVVQKIGADVIAELISCLDRISRKTEFTVNMSVELRF